MGNPPFLLKPACKDYLWGGTRLRDDYGKETTVLPLAESWDCSTHPDGVSLAASGPYSGKSLAEILEEHPEFLGTHPQSSEIFPVLIKFIDAKQDLSVQVHPDDEYARIHENGQLGKTELWYILHAEEGARIVYGFQRDVSEKELLEALHSGTIGKLLQYVPVKKNDVFLVEAGTVHAIGHGIVLAEIQQASNLTYRLYDYDRIDKNGCKRQLHIKKALDVVNRNSSAAPRQPMRTLNYHNGYALELLGRCRYFQVERMLLNTERCRAMADFRTGSNSFHILLCTDGCGILTGEENLLFFKGDCIFVPADSGMLKLHGKAQLLSIGC